jgi:hypothetical protein
VLPTLSVVNEASKHAVKSDGLQSGTEVLHLDTALMTKTALGVMSS